MADQNDTFYSGLQKFEPVTTKEFSDKLRTNRQIALLHISEFYYVSTPEEDRKVDAIAYESGLKQPSWNHLKTDQQLVQEYEALVANRLALLQCRQIAKRCQALRDSGKIEEARSLIRASGGTPNF